MSDIERQLANLGARREKARQTIRDISRELPAVARAALAEGIEKRRIAELANISRPALNTMLDTDLGEHYQRLFVEGLTSEERRAVLDDALRAGADRDELERIERRLKDQGDIPEMDV